MNMMYFLLYVLFIGAQSFGFIYTTNKRLSMRWTKFECKFYFNCKYEEIVVYRV